MNPSGNAGNKHVKLLVDSNKKPQSLGVSFEKRNLQRSLSISVFFPPFLSFPFLQIQIPSLLKWGLKFIMGAINIVLCPNVYIFSSILTFLMKPGRSDSKKKVKVLEQ